MKSIDPDEILTAVKHSQDVYEKVQDYEQFAYVYSKWLSDNVFDPDDLSINQFVKISCNGKPIFRKCAARNGLSKGEISLGNRTFRELGIAPGAHVTVKKSSWISYQFHNSDCSKKWAFTVAIFGLICSILSLIIAVISLFFHLPLF